MTIKINEIALKAFKMQHDSTELVSINCEKTPLYDELEECEIHNEIGIETAASQSGDQYISFLKCTCKGTSDNQELYRINLLLRGVSHIVDKDVVISDEEIDNFKNITVIRSMWPYLRETLHDLTYRMNIPDLSVPTIDIVETFKNGKIPE